MIKKNNKLTRIRNIRNHVNGYSLGSTVGALDLVVAIVCFRFEDFVAIDYTVILCRNTISTTTTQLFDCGYNGVELVIIETYK